MDAVERRFYIARLVEAVGVRLFLIGVMSYIVGSVSARVSGFSQSEQTESTLGQVLVWLFFGFTVGVLHVLLVVLLGLVLGFYLLVDLPTIQRGAAAMLPGRRRVDRHVRLRFGREYDAEPVRREPALGRLEPRH